MVNEVPGSRINKLISLRGHKWQSVFNSGKFDVMLPRKANEYTRMMKYSE